MRNSVSLEEEEIRKLISLFFFCVTFIGIKKNVMNKFKWGEINDKYVWKY